MEHKFELMFLGAAALLFAMSIGGWLLSDRQFEQSLYLLERHMNEERVVVEKGGT